MADTYRILCTNCEAEVEFEISEIEALETDIDREVEEARKDKAREFEGMIYPSDIIYPRQWQDLAAAIRRGDRVEAELLLDRIADEIGVTSLVEHVQLGRYRPSATAGQAELALEA